MKAITPMISINRNNIFLYKLNMRLNWELATPIKYPKEK